MITSLEQAINLAVSIPGHGMQATAFEICRARGLDPYAIAMHPMLGAAAQPNWLMVIAEAILERQLAQFVTQNMEAFYG